MKHYFFYIPLVVFFLFIACSKADVATEEKTEVTTETKDDKDDNDDDKDDTDNDITDTRETASRVFTPCENGLADVFPCNGYDLLSRISIADFKSSSGNDVWGWTDQQTGKEYALMGLDDGTGFIDISDPKAPIYLGKLPTATHNIIWRDIKVYSNHAYIVSEAPNHGLQVFDLTHLRGITEEQTFNADTEISSFGNAHNIAIDEASGFAYVIGSTKNSGGPVIFDLQDPKNPKEVGGYSGANYTHDAQIVVYDGPDSDHVGKQIYIGSNENKVVILDVTDKQNITKISDISYSQPYYTHQGWFSSDFHYFFVGDELDEIRTGAKTRILVFDVSNLEEPKLHYTYHGPSEATDHNMYVRGDELFLANYRAGFRKIDISQIQDKKMEEVAFFDSFPLKNSSDMAGAWSVYPFFESKVVLISDMHYGLLLVKSN